MPLVTTLIDDKSPLITYDASWIPGSSTLGDQMASDYYLGTFVVNNVTDGSMTFNFNGTAVWIYGAKRTNHGSFVVQIDSTTYSNLNGEGNNIFQQSIFNASVDQGMHTVKLTNTATGSLYVDIDMIVWQSEVGSTDDQLVTETVQDTDSRFQYQEPAWATTSSDSNFNLALFNNGSGHVTQIYDASVTFTFTVGFFSFGLSLLLMYCTGHVTRSVYRCVFLTDLSAEAVSLFGTSGPSNGQYSVQLDGGQNVTYNATDIYPTNYGVTIYHADNLGPGLHEIILTNLPTSSGQSLAIDYAQLLTIANTTTNPTSPTDSTSTSQNSTLSSGVIAAMAIMAVATVLSAGLAVLFYRRWKDALATHQDLFRVYTLQRGPPEPVTVPPTGFSSTLEMRSNGSLLRNDITPQPSSGRTQQPADDQGAIRILPVSRDSRSIVDSISVSLPPQSPVDENLGRRLLPEAPGGTELPKLADPAHDRNVLITDQRSIATSVAGSEAPPNYTQAIGNH